MKKCEDTGYQAVRWNEPLIFELGKKGRRGFDVPRSSEELKESVGDIKSDIPESIRRKDPPGLPELTEPEVLRHFIRLSQQTYGTDSGINAGVGTCTMKYNPKINEKLARAAKLAHLHPDQEEETVQGILEIMYRLKQWLCVISGLDEFSLQPRGGAHAVFANATIMKAYLQARGELEQRNEIITTVLSHPCNASSPGVAGMKILSLYPDEETGIPSVEALKEAVSDKTVGMMITDPYDTGVFDDNITEYIDIVHDAGGLVAIDQANANCILGKLRIGDTGADLCHFNLHKSFSTPHGSCGPGSAPIGAREELAEFLPTPLVEFDGERYYLERDRPKSIGQIGSYYGVVPNAIRAYTWIMTTGAEGMEEVSEIAVLNSNYLARKLIKIKGIDLPWFDSHPLRMQEGRFTVEKMKEDTGIGIADVNRRIVDFGIQRCFTSHEPWIVPEPFTPEPTESVSKEDLDRFAEIFQRVSDEAYNNPEIVKDAPHCCSISKVDLGPATDSEKWATTWRAYIKKRERD
ncbi:MAG: aminotransferase class V-fold PLP-dependent enzyme [Candidatus Lokiarchaeota archaeon]|nr:aminotransferase class V-fold PLP-dependent enzyme [Candidatus Lokiarchaeota archaeon]